ncbi:MAG TPA: HAMP domain-containing sensor histidine kinase [Candidatus Dormibacteraeota bacterium]|nr:HAMP domain-containing sensor histidine kinase [Candidatus Dormibacteraeota bacterium]
MGRRLGRLTGVVRRIRPHPLASARRRRRERDELTQREAAKSAFLRLAAHELRTPIAVTRGYVEMLREGDLGPMADAAVDALAQVEARLGEMDELVMEMTELARVQQGPAGLRIEELDLYEVVEEAGARVRPLLGARHHLLIERPAAPMRAAGDRLRIRTVLVNLLGNAIKYSPDGGVIRARIERGDGWLHVRVSDQGVGLDPAELDRLFQPFSRLSAARAVEAPGLGLGLYVACEIARVHGGRVEGGPGPRGRGSVFTFSLPSLPGDPEPAAVPDQRRPVPAVRARGAQAALR